MNRLYRKLPLLINSILISSEGWLVGGSIEALINGKEIRDWDIIVPSRELYQATVIQLSANPYVKYVVNSFGGFKFYNEEFEIDIWPEELDHFLKKGNKVSYVYNLSRNILLKNALLEQVKK